MTTFCDPAKIRELAATGDPFWNGAAWVLDQQDAARPYSDAWMEDGPLFSREEVSARRRYRERKLRQAREGDWNWDDDWSPTPAA